MIGLALLAWLAFEITLIWHWKENSHDETPV